MDLAGDFIFDGPQDIVWEAIRDPNVLGSIMPGGEGVEEIGENEYAAKLKIKVGPVQGKFKGNIKLLNIVEPDSYDIEVDGKGAPGFVKASGNLQLVGEGEKTLMTYSGQARVGGKIASVGQRLLDASTKAIVNQSLEALNDYIKAQVQGESQTVVEVETVVETTVVGVTNEGISAETSTTAEAAPTKTSQSAFQAPPPPPSTYQPPSQTQLAASIMGEIFDDLVPKQAQPVVISFLTTLVTMFVFRLFSRKK